MREGAARGEGRARACRPSRRDCAVPRSPRWRLGLHSVAVVVPRERERQEQERRQRLVRAHASVDERAVPRGVVAAQVRRQSPCGGWRHAADRRRLPGRLRRVAEDVALGERRRPGRRQRGVHEPHARGHEGSQGGLPVLGFQRRRRSERFADGSGGGPPALHGAPETHRRIGRRLAHPCGGEPHIALAGERLVARRPRRCRGGRRAKAA
mmetsp:Transcript_54410/g.150784  ORF Transcript_54410/g.150784 Transcript_54410/m.150784 type:complete len:210 (-) Transcript_54410:241-870(-)